MLRAGDTRQAIPLTGYYSLVLAGAESSTPPRGSSLVPMRPASVSTFTPEDDAKKAPAIVNGVLLSSRPEEPDNCCMSGCVHCVWDIYREELEAWSVAQKSAMAQVHQKDNETADTSMKSRESEISGNAIDQRESTDAGHVQQSAGQIDEKLLEDIPVGIREFMKQEKRLQQAKLAREASGNT